MIQMGMGYQQLFQFKAMFLDNRHDLVDIAARKKLEREPEQCRQDKQRQRPTKPGSA